MGGVQGQQVGLLGDAGDQLDDVADLAAGRAERGESTSIASARAIDDLGLGP
jgi:hypothetical protein